MTRLSDSLLSNKGLHGIILTGDSGAGDVLTGKTFYTTDPKVKLTGTMPNRIGQQTALNNYVVGTTLSLLAPAGKYDGVNSTVAITDADFIAANIKTGVNLFGLAGSLAPAPSMVASNYVRASADVQVSTQNTSDVKMKEIRIGLGGIVRVSFDMTTTPDGYGYGRIYKNGAAYGTQRTAAYIHNYVTWVEDLVFEAGDYVQLYGRSLGGSYPMYYRNFRLMYTEGLFAITLN